MEPALRGKALRALPHSLSPGLSRYLGITPRPPPVPRRGLHVAAGRAHNRGDPMPRRKTPPPLTLMPPEAAVPKAPLRLALGGGSGVRLVLEAADAAAVEAAAAALKARFGARFAITGRRRAKAGLRVTASLQVSTDEALDAAAPVGEG